MNTNLWATDYFKTAARIVRPGPGQGVFGSGSASGSTPPSGSPIVPATKAPVKKALPGPLAG